MSTVSRLLLAAVSDAASHLNETGYHGDDEHVEYLSHELHVDDGHGGGHGGHTAPFTFEDILGLGALIWIIWIAGMLSEKCQLPSLIGEIFAGILCGPHGMDIAPKHTALMLIGEMGLCLMVLEAGIEVDLAQLALVGGRGIMVAFAGSLGPLAIGFVLALGVFGMEIKSALAVGASLAPTSMGISLKVLQEGKVLNTPTGQLIIAAAVIDDVIALVLLSELEALEDPTPLNFILPIVSSVSFILVVGYGAIKVIPNFLAKRLIPMIPAHLIEPSLLAVLLGCGYMLMAACYYGKTSYLLGAFLGGLCFCTLSTVEHVWHVKVRGLLVWLVKIFFACSIGFEVPIRDLWTPAVLTKTAVFLLVAFGKLGTGLFCRPFNWRDASIIGFAMSAWGEFAFIVATASREAGSLDEETYAAIILAVLLSAVYSPLMVKVSCAWPKTTTQDIVQATTEIIKRISMDGRPSMQNDEDRGPPAYRGSLDVSARVYFACSIRCRSHWGLTDRLLKNIQSHAEIVDFRVHTNGGWLLYQAILCDVSLRDTRTDEEREQDHMAQLKEGDLEHEHEHMSSDPEMGHSTTHLQFRTKVDSRRMQVNDIICDTASLPRTAPKALCTGHKQPEGDVLLEQWYPTIEGLGARPGSSDVAHLTHLTRKESVYRQAFSAIFSEDVQDSGEKQSPNPKAAGIYTTTGRPSVEDQSSLYTSGNTEHPKTDTYESPVPAASPQQKKRRLQRMNSLSDVRHMLNNSADTEVFQALVHSREEKEKADARKQRDDIGPGAAALLNFNPQDPVTFPSRRLLDAIDESSVHGIEDSLRSDLHGHLHGHTPRNHHLTPLHKQPGGKAAPGHGSCPDFSASPSEETSLLGTASGIARFEDQILADQWKATGAGVADTDERSSTTVSGASGATLANELKQRLKLDHDKDKEKGQNSRQSLDS